nr:hypothetical protein B0A51_05226 [Rachicladosporium sp. CCFEE 5018]
MSLTLLQPATNTSPHSAISLSRAGTTFIKSQSTYTLPWPLSLLANESQEKWQIYENVFLACLRTGDNQSASQCLEKLVDRFGKSNERVIALRGLFQEATAADAAALGEVLKQYDQFIVDDPTVFPIRKRRAALLRSMGKLNEAVIALTELVDVSPTDAESWAELADCYLTKGSFEQAVFCLEEVLLVTPNAWNMHARLGEVLFLRANDAEGAEKAQGLAEAMRRFCRSVELCDDYLRGYYGLKLSTNRLIPLLTSSNSKSGKSADTAAALSSQVTVQKLNQLATLKLGDILRRSKGNQKSWDGYSEAELIAAKELLDRDSDNAVR